MRLFSSASDCGRIHSRSCDAAQQAHHQRRVQRGGQAFADHVSHIKAQLPVGQLEEIRKISADSCKRGEPVGNLKRLPPTSEPVGNSEI